MSPDGPSVVVCTECSFGRRAVDAARIGGRVVAVCEVCEREDPTRIRRTGSTARLLGLDVEDVRGLYR
jgi:hypothetical protein